MTLDALIDRADAWGADGSGRDGLDGFLRTAAERYHLLFEQVVHLALDEGAAADETKLAAILERLLTAAGSRRH